jgi:hypothetical protein
MVYAIGNLPIPRDYFPFALGLCRGLEIVIKICLCINNRAEQWDYNQNSKCPACHESLSNHLFLLFLMTNNDQYRKQQLSEHNNLLNKGMKKTLNIIEIVPSETPNLHKHTKCFTSYLYQITLWYFKKKQLDRGD